MIVFVDDPADHRLAGYAAISDPQLARDRGLFVAEGRFVVDRLIADRRFAVQSVLVTATALAALSPVLGTLPDSVPVFVLPAHHVQSVTGFNIHRGCLALAARGPRLTVEECVRSASRLVVLEGITNADNIGGIFRNAAAFGVDAVILSPGCCDPLYRKAIRTSMAATLRVPFADAEAWPDVLRRLRESGFSLLALTPQAPSMTLAQLALSAPPAKWAFLLGTEGDGLTAAALAHADCRVRIPIGTAVDSLNVAVASGIALSRLSGGAGL